MNEAFWDLVEDLSTIPGGRELLGQGFEWLSKVRQTRCWKANSRG